MDTALNRWLNSAQSTRVKDNPVASGLFKTPNSSEVRSRKLSPLVVGDHVCEDGEAALVG